jgi:putative addiction module component (TIGR02574 family)
MEGLVVGHEIRSDSNFLVTSLVCLLQFRKALEEVRMSVNLTSHEIITSALQLPPAEREQVVDALQNSLIDTSVDHGSEEPAEEVRAAWSDEISRRITDLDAGRSKPIPAEAAEGMIRSDARPRI